MEKLELMQKKIFDLYRNRFETLQNLDEIKLSIEGLITADATYDHTVQAKKKIKKRVPYNPGRSQSIRSASTCSVALITNRVLWIAVGWKNYVLPTTANSITTNHRKTSIGASERKGHRSVLSWQCQYFFATQQKLREPESKALMYMPCNPSLAPSDDYSFRSVQNTFNSVI